LYEGRLMESSEGMSARSRMRRRAERVVLVSGWPGIKISVLRRITFDRPGIDPTVRE
jgi:hypothetical protein